MAVTGDIGLIFSNDNDNSTNSSTNGLLIAPHSTSAQGIKILEDGRVGIATTTPNSRFTVNVGSQGDGIELQSSEVSIAKLSRTTYSSTVVASLDGVTGRPIHIGGIVNEDVLLANAGGNVGIGTNAPNNTLDVNSGVSDWPIRARSTDAKAGILIQDNNTTNYLISQSYTLSIGNQASLHANNLNIKSTGNVGIGTTNPTDPLVVQSSGSIGGGATNANSYFTVTDGTHGLYHDPNEIFSDINGTFHIGANHANGSLRFHTGGTSTRMIILSNGNVGIGAVTNPQSLLDISDGLSDTKYLRTHFPSATNYNAASANTEGRVPVGLRFGWYSDYWQIGGARSGNSNIDGFIISDTGAERLVISNTGKVGIGTTAPSKKLHVEDSSAYQLQLDGGNNFWNVGAGWSGYYDGSFLIANNTGDKLVIDSNGKVGIGTNSPLDLLHIKSTSTDARQVIDGHTGFDAELKFAENGTVKYTIGHDAASDNFVIGTTNVDTQQRLVINSAGNVGVGVTSIPSWANLMTDGTVAVGGILYMKTANAIQALSNYPGGASDLKMQSSGGKVTIGGPGGSTTGHLELYGRYSGNDPKLSFRSDHPTSGNNTVWDMARIIADDGGNYNGVLHFQVAAGNGSENSGAALATAMTIQDTKYVGIGTTNPDTHLEVDIQNGADGNGIHITSTSTTNDPTLKLTRNGSADRFQFMIRGGAGSARLGISAGTNLDSGLNLGSNNGLSIGTVTAAGSGGLLVDNDIKSNSRFGVGSGGSLSDAAIYKNSDTNTGIYWPGTDQIALTTAGSNRLHIASNGGVSLNSQSQLTTGGNARLSIIDSSVQLSMGASNNDMSYIRKQGAGQFAWQTYNSGNSGILQLQPYGGNVTINTTAAVSGHALSVSGKIGGLTYSDSYVQFTGGNAILKANDDVVIGYASSLYVKQSGKVGVGTSNPKAEFQVDHAGIDTYAVNTSATSAAQVDTFSSTEFRSARFTVQITNTTDSTYQITEILLIHDGTTPSMTEYGTIFTGSAREASFDADIVSGNVRLLATPASTDTMQFKVVRHSILV